MKSEHQCNDECFDVTFCGDIDPITKYHCTRKSHHDGKHVACSNEHDLAVWS
jgi:hypothetical protein